MRLLQGQTLAALAHQQAQRQHHGQCCQADPGQAAQDGGVHRAAVNARRQPPVGAAHRQRHQPGRPLVVRQPGKHLAGRPLTAHHAGQAHRAVALQRPAQLACGVGQALEVAERQQRVTITPPQPGLSRIAVQLPTLQQGQQLQLRVQPQQHSGTGGPAAGLQRNHQVQPQRQGAASLPVRRAVQHLAAGHGLQCQAAHGVGQIGGHTGLGSPHLALRVQHHGGHIAAAAAVVDRPLQQALGRRLPGSAVLGLQPGRLGQRRPQRAGGQETGRCHLGAEPGRHLQAAQLGQGLQALAGLLMQHVALSGHRQKGQQRHQPQAQPQRPAQPVSVGRPCAWR